jgi:hypothetical protein
VNDLRSAQSLPSSTVAVQDPVVVQEQVIEPVQEQIEQQMNPEQGNSVAQVPRRRSTRSYHAPDRLNLMVLYDIENEDRHIDDDSKSYVEAIQSLDREKWQKAMDSKMESMKINKVWTLVEASKDIKPIGCKWVYKKKIGADGKVETFFFGKIKTAILSIAQGVLTQIQSSRLIKLALLPRDIVKRKE